MQMIQKQTVQLNTEITLYVETFGDPQHDPILLVMGVSSPGMAWGDYFCSKLAENDYFVIRFDHRDTGKSTCRDYTKYPYDLTVLMQDVHQLLIKLQITAAHLIGTSMGGYIAQLLAINYPNQVKSLSIIASSFDLATIVNPKAKQAGKIANPSKLPLPYPETIEMLSAESEIETESVPESKDEADDYTQVLNSWRILNGTKSDFDQDLFLQVAKARAKHNIKPDYLRNNFLAIINTEYNITDKLSQLNIPTLVIHGDSDPLIPLAHGEALAQIIPHAKFCVIKNMGHLLELFYDQILAELLHFYSFQ